MALELQQGFLEITSILSLLQLLYEVKYENCPYPFLSFFFLNSESGRNLNIYVKNCFLVIKYKVFVAGLHIYAFLSLSLVLLQVHPTQEDIEIHTTTQQCVSQHYTSWIVGMIIFKGIFLLFGVFLAWETRNVNYAELNDSKNIGVAVYNIFLFSGLSITAEFVLSNLEAKRIFNNSLIYLCTTMALGLVFIPKV